MFVMYCVNGKSRSSLLIEYTDSMIIVLYNYIDSEIVVSTRWSSLRLTPIISRRACDQLYVALKVQMLPAQLNPLCRTLNNTQIHRNVGTMLQFYSVSRIHQHHYQAQYHKKTRILASSSPEATTSVADLSHINNSKNGLPSCTSDTFRDLQVQVLLSDIEFKLTFSLASMITQALVPLRTFVVDQFNALSNNIIIILCILEEDLRRRLDMLETEVNHTR